MIEDDLENFSLIKRDVCDYIQEFNSGNKISDKKDLIDMEENRKNIDEKPRVYKIKNA